MCPVGKVVIHVPGLAVAVGNHPEIVKPVVVNIGRTACGEMIATPRDIEIPVFIIFWLGSRLEIYLSEVSRVERIFREI